MNTNLIRLFHLEQNYGDSNRLFETYNKFIEFWRSDKTKERRTFIKDWGLSEDDIYPISAYTSGGTNGNYIPRLINCSIKTGISQQPEKLLIRLLDQSLQKLPCYNNKVVYRWVDGLYFDNFHDQINLFRKNIGQNFEVYHFLSTSKVNAHNRMTWKIDTHPENSKARDIEMLSASALKSEEEVLFERNSQFLIVGIEEQKDEYIVLLREIVGASKHSLVFKNQLESINPN
jgi:hypothetical protein